MGDERARRPLQVVGALCVRGQTVLATLRPEGVKRGGMWEFPGGKVEAGEDPRQALKRELEEELALRVTVGQLVHTVHHAYADVSITLFIYRCEAHGEAQLIEAADARWLTPAQLDALPVAPADVPVVRALLDEGIPPLLR